MKSNWRNYLAVCTMALLTACGPAGNSGEQASETKKAQPAAAKPAAAQSAKPEPRTCKFTMGYDVWEPYQFVGFGREIQGMDVELVKLVSDELNCDVEYKQDSWGNLLSMLREGKIDFVLGASITEERKSFALFSDAYRTEEFRLYVRADEEHKYRQASVSDFVKDNNKLGIIGEYFYGDDLTALMDNEQYAGLFTPAFMGEINVARLIDGDINGFLEDSFVGASMLRRKGLDKYITAHQASIKTGDVYVMFSKASVAQTTVDKFNRALTAIKNNGQYDALVRKYSE